MICLAENHAMRHLARRCACRVVLAEGEAEACPDLPAIDPGSLLTEILMEGGALFNSLVETWSLDPTPPPAPSAVSKG